MLFFRAFFRAFFLEAFPVSRLAFLGLPLAVAPIRSTGSESAIPRRSQETQFAA